MPQKSISGRNLNNAITSEDLLGKEVIDVKGKVIGVVEKVLIDPNKLNLIGLSIDKGLLHRGISIGKNYIGRITKKAVFLKIKIAYEVKGSSVFDKDGKLMGKVTDVELKGNQNKIKNIIVKKGLFRKKLKIPAEFIEVLGDNIILNKTKKSLVKLIYNFI